MSHTFCKRYCTLFPCSPSKFVFVLNDNSSHNLPFLIAINRHHIAAFNFTVNFRTLRNSGIERVWILKNSKVRRKRQDVDLLGPVQPTLLQAELIAFIHVRETRGHENNDYCEEDGGGEWRGPLRCWTGPASGHVCTNPPSPITFITTAYPRLAFSRLYYRKVTTTSVTHKEDVDKYTSLDDCEFHEFSSINSRQIVSHFYHLLFFVVLRLTDITADTKMCSDDFSLSFNLDAKCHYTWFQIRF